MGDMIQGARSPGHAVGETLAGSNNVWDSFFLAARKSTAAWILGSIEPGENCPCGDHHFGLVRCHVSTVVAVGLPKSRIEPDRYRSGSPADRRQPRRRAWRVVRSLSMTASTPTKRPAHRADGNSSAAGGDDRPPAANESFNSGSSIISRGSGEGTTLPPAAAGIFARLPSAFACVPLATVRGS